MEIERFDAIVIGAGMTGLTASKALLRHGLRVANIEGGVFGGLITNVNELEGDFAGSGADLASTLMMEVSDLGGATLSETVLLLAVEPGGLVLDTDAGTRRARTVVVASGAKLRRLGVAGEADLEYKGVSYCADCDGPMYQGQDVVVVGGGDSALQEALVLSRFCRSVQIVHHGPSLSAASHWQSAIALQRNVTTLPMAEVTAIEGRDSVSTVRLKSLADGTERTLPCTGVFTYVGLAPSTEFLPHATRRDVQGALITTDALETSMPGVFAAGAARSGFGGRLGDAVREATLVAKTLASRLGE